MTNLSMIEAFGLTKGTERRWHWQGLTCGTRRGQSSASCPNGAGKTTAIRILATSPFPITEARGWRDSM